MMAIEVRYEENTKIVVAAYFRGHGCRPIVDAALSTLESLTHHILSPAIVACPIRAHQERVRRDRNLFLFERRSVYQLGESDMLFYVLQQLVYRLQSDG